MVVEIPFRLSEICGACSKLGNAEQVYLPWRPEVPSPTWRSFLHNHLHGTAAVDMFLVVTARFQLLYALVVLGHERRTVIHSMSTETRHKAGWRAKSPRPFPGIPRLAFCCATATGHTVRPSAIVSRRWRSRRSSLHRGRRGRTPMSSASSARSAANVLTTLSSSMSVTCAVCCWHILSITTEAARISRSARIVRHPGSYSHPLPAPLSPSRRSAVCTITTSVAQRELLPVTGSAAISTLRVVAVGKCGGHGPEPVAWPSDSGSGQSSLRVIENHQLKASTVLFQSRPGIARRSCHSWWVGDHGNRSATRKVWIAEG